MVTLMVLELSEMVATIGTMVECMVMVITEVNTTVASQTKVNLSVTIDQVTKHSNSIRHGIQINDRAMMVTTAAKDKDKDKVSMDRVSMVKDKVSMVKDKASMDKVSTDKDKVSMDKGTTISGTRIMTVIKGIKETISTGLVAISGSTQTIEPLVDVVTMGKGTQGTMVPCLIRHRWQ